MASSPLFTGIMTALVTPFHLDGTFDEESYRQLIEQQIASGIDGLIPCGTTGEAATLSETERLTVIQTCVDAVKGRVPVIAGAGHNDTQTAIRYQKQMKELGVDGTLQVTPWYNKPCQDGLYHHFSEILKQAPMPTVLYNVPGRCGVDLQASTVARLAEKHSDIVAIKEATGSIARAQDILCRVHDSRTDFSVLSGDDGFILGLLAIGGHGVISVISHLCAEDLVAMKQAFLNGEQAQAQRLSRKVSPLTPALFFRPNPVPVKAALSRCEYIDTMTEHVRAPLITLDDAGWDVLHTALKEAGYDRKAS